MSSMTTPTPRELEVALHKGGPRTQQAVEALYLARQSFIDDLRERGEVTLDDLRELDRLGRCVVASEMLLDCTEEAVEALLNDEHHAVRSCALLSAEASACNLH